MQSTNYDSLVQTLVEYCLSKQVLSDQRLKYLFQDLEDEVKHELSLLTYKDK